jgi:2-phospho-L-lactate guanylyltransferase (CobY/MobA/RfbA family)
MLPNRLGHVFSEPSAEPFAAAQLVAVINAARRWLAAELVDQMSNVMPQAIFIGPQ